MARPSKTDISSGNLNWDVDVDDNDEVVLNAPLPIHEHTGDESDLESTFAAASYDRCHVMVDHTTYGWVRYVSDGSSWKLTEFVENPIVIAPLANGTGGSGNNTVAAVSGSGDDSTINNNFSDLIDKIAEITAVLKLLNQVADA